MKETPSEPWTPASEGCSYLLLRVAVAFTWWLTLLVSPFVVLSPWFFDGPMGIEVELPPCYVGLPSPEATAPLVDVEGVRATVFLGIFEVGASVWLCTLAQYGLWIFLLGQVRGLMSSLRKDPFVEANGARLDRMGWGLLALCALQPLRAIVVGHRLRDLPAQLGHEVELPLDFSFYGLLFAALLFVLARVFRIGVALQKERELVV